MQPRPRLLLPLCFALLALFCLDSPRLHAPRSPEPSVAPDARWLSRIQEQLRRAEYCVTWQESTCLSGLTRAYQAPNRAQNLRTYFTADGFRMTSRTDPKAGWEWGLRLAAYGFAGAERAPAKAELAPRQNRIEYRRGDLVEWYVNDERGLEQGFTLARPPAGGAAAGAPLVLDLALTGGLRPATSAPGGKDALVLCDVAGTPRVRYGQLAAFDATGRPLPATMELVAGGAVVRLAVDAIGAEYPITVDPLSQSVGWSVEGNQAGAGFGGEVAGAGDVNGDGYGDIIVGAGGYDIGFNNEGAAFVYLGSTTGPSLTPHWTGRGLRELANFGSAVGTAGDVNGDGYADVVVGAPGYNSLADGGGAAFVFHGGFGGLGPSGYPVNANWQWIGDVALGHLGQSVGTAGDVNGDGCSEVIVGTPYDKFSGVTRGSARVFWGSPVGLTWDPWVMYGLSGGSRFGTSVATAGDVNGDGYADVIVGAPMHDAYAEGDDYGGAFVFLGPDFPDGPGNWFWWYGHHTGSQFGAAVGTAGDINGDGYAEVIVGEPLRSNGQASEGSASVFFGSASGPSQIAGWSVEGNQGGAQLGSAVAGAGDVNGDGYADVLVGAAAFDNPEVNEGFALLYFGSADGLTQTGDPFSANWRYQPDRADQWIGYSVAAAGDVNGDGLGDVLVGSPYYDDELVDEGVALLFYGTRSGMASGMQWGGYGGQAGAQLGTSVAGVDIYGFNRGSIAIGAPYFDSGQADEGVVWVYYGRSFGELSAAPDWTAQADQANAHFGAAVGSAGDVNGDGFEDLVVGAPGYSDGGLTGEGHAFVWYGGFQGLGAVPGTPANAVWSAESNLQGAQFGRAVGTAGDMNGDGYSDVIVGAPLFDNPEVDEGAAFVWLGAAAGLGDPGVPLNADWHAEANRAASGLGFSCGSAGDVNGDGYSDVIVGVPLYDVLVTDTGRALTWYGGASGLGAVGTPANADWSASGSYGGGQFGYSVGTAGDVDGDGYSDVVVGAPYHMETLAGCGRMSLYAGSATGLATGSRVTRYGTQVNERLGWVVGTAGDVNRDGLADVFAASPYYDAPRSPDGGKLSVWYGPETADEPTAADDWVYGGSGGLLGYAAACAGDVNSDGYADLVLGAPGYSGSSLDEGAAFVWFGGGTRLNRAVGPTQDNVDIESPVARFNITEEATRFCLGLQGFSPFGTGQAKLEYEIQPLGVPLDGSHVLRVGPWIDLQARAYGTGMRTVVDGPAHSKLHWRVRMRYNPATTPLLTAGPWMSIPTSAWSELKLRTPPSPVAVVPAPVGGGTLALAPGAPNPFVEATVLRFTLPAAAIADLTVFDARGRRVRTLWQERPAAAGPHAVAWDGRDDAGRTVRPGVYFARLVTPGGEAATRLVRTRP